MKIKTSDLKDQALDWAVSTVADLPYPIVYDEQGQEVSVSPSTVWTQGGPIIERECLELEVEEGVWHSRTSFGFHYYSGKGPTPLVAAMRCYVASKLGDEVDVPDELVEAAHA